MKPSHALLVIALAAGCGGSDPIDQPDAASVDPDANGTCNAVELTAAPIIDMDVAEDIPAPLGGELPDGDYALTAALHYTGPGGASGPTGVEEAANSHMVGGVSQYVHDGVNRLVHETYTLVADGTSLTMTRTCPDTAVIPADGFTQTGDTITFYDSVDGVALEYTRVP